MKKFYSVCILTTLFLCSCVISTSRDDLLKKETFYTKNIDSNYLKLGKCIKDQLPLPRSISYVTPVAAGGIMINVPQSQVLGTEGHDDSENKIYYINDFTKIGSNTLKNWLIIVKSTNSKNTKSEIEIKGKKSIWNKPVFSVDYLGEKINNCIN